MADNDVSYHMQTMLGDCPHAWESIPFHIGVRNRTLRALEDRGLVETRLRQLIVFEWRRKGRNSNG